MTNTKTTKRALLMSVMALFLCVTMLMGTTYAWFTDSVTSANNKIVAGNLDVQLFMIDENGRTEITNEAAPIFGASDGALANKNTADTVWEPGKTQVVFLSIKNNGNLDLKYKVAIDVKNVTKNLNDVMKYVIVPDAQYGDTLANIDWATEGQSVLLGANEATAPENVELKATKEHFFALVVHMDEDAGNDYKEGTIDFDMTVLAAQLNSEADSFGPDYDKDALFAVADDLYVDKTTGGYIATTAKGLSSAAALASTDDTITSVTYATEAGNVEVPVVRDNAGLDTAISSNNDTLVLTNGTFIVPDSAKNKALTIVGADDTVLAAQDDGAAEGDCDYSFDGSTVTFENVTITTSTTYYPGYVRMKATYNNCTINGTYTLYDDSVFNNCTFDTNDGYVWTWGASKAEFNNCTFESDVAKAILVHGGTSADIVVKDCKFIAKQAAYTWNKLYVAAVSIDPTAANVTYNVQFEGTNTVTTADGATADTFGNIGYAGLHQVKDAAESSQITVSVNGEAVANVIAQKFE